MGQESADRTGKNSIGGYLSGPGVIQELSSYHRGEEVAAGPVGDVPFDVPAVLHGEGVRPATIGPTLRGRPLGDAASGAGAAAVPCLGCGRLVGTEVARRGEPTLWEVELKNA